MTERVFSLVFPDCVPPQSSLDPTVRSVRVKKEQGSMEIDLHDATGQVSEAWLGAAKSQIRRLYGLRDIRFSVDKPVGVRRAATEAKERPVPTQRGASAARKGPGLWGKPSTALEPLPMNDLPEPGRDICVRGTIFKFEDVRERRGRIGQRWTMVRTLEFLMHDQKGGVRVQMVFEAKSYPEDLEKILKGMRKSKEPVLVTGKLVNIARGEREEQILEAAYLAPCPAEPRMDKAPEKRVELHLHTQMSEKDATTAVSEVVAMAARWGHPAVAITDHGVCHSFPEAMQAGKKHGIKIIYGVEGYLPPEPGSKQRFHIILLCRTQRGLRNLYTLVSLSHIKHYKGRPMIPWELLEEYREGLIIGTACEAGELFRAIMKGEDREKLLDIGRRYDYMEIQPICNNAFMVREGMAADDEQLRDYNRKVVSIADELGKPVCATGDVHFLNPEDEVYRKVLLASMNMETEFPLPLYFKTTEEMLEEFSYLGEERAYDVVVRQPAALAAMMEEVSPVRSGEFFPKLKGTAEELERLTRETAARLYGDPLPEILSERMEKELGAIIKHGYDIIYMISQKLVKRSYDDGFLVGSRGSVGSSIVAYLAGISEVNALPPHYRCPACRYYEFPDEKSMSAACGPDMPNKDCPKCGEKLVKDGFNIPFATFLGFDADKKPDIDLNFSSDYQPRAHAYAVELFGEEKVYRAGTISTIAEKTAYGYSRKYAEREMLPLGDADLLWLANGCEGVKSTTGQHPGGLIIVPEDMNIYDFCPVQYPANKPDQPICTHFDYHAIEENLLKLDLLGHDGPTLLKHLEDMTGKPAMSVPLDDEETMSLFKTTEKLGFTGDKVIGDYGSVAIPEFGTKFVRGILKKTKPSTFDELVRISGLSHGENVWRGNAEDLVDQGVASLKQIVCARDDITLFLTSKGMPAKQSFEISEAVRKGKGLRPEWEAGMRDAAVPGWYIDSCKKIKYMFPKAHAVAYVMMSIKIAWFKVHEPIAFYSAWFSAKIGDFETLTAVRGMDACRKRMMEIEGSKTATKKDQDKAVILEVVYEFLRRGYVFAPVDLYASEEQRFMPEGNGIRIPLLAIPGLGEIAAKSIAAERVKRPFMSIEDVQSHCRVTKTHMDTMRGLGMFKDLPESTQMSLFEM